MIDNFATRAAQWDTPEKMKMTRTFVEEVLKQIELKPDWKGLEVGAGTGLVGFELLPHIKSLVFEDTSDAMLEVLKGKTRSEHPVEIVKGEVFDYKSQDIDFVFSCMAFHHIPDINAALSHLNKITNPGAVLAIGDLRSEDGSFHRFEPIPHTGFDLDELTAQFTKAGFNVEKAYTYNVLNRERTPGVFTKYEQFILIAKKS